MHQLAIFILAFFSLGANERLTKSESSAAGQVKQWEHLSAEVKRKIWLVTFYWHY